MLNRLRFACAAVVFASLCAGVSGAQALTMQECSAKYKAAQTAKSLNGKTWSQFRKDECGPKVAAAPTAAAAPAKTAAPAPAAPAKTALSPSVAVYPAAVSSKYASESAGRARMHTCRDQYNANKATNSNGGLKWIEKNGGYYSECNKRLKG